jgi:hypothetical protein
MTIFQLALYSCVTTHSMVGDMSMTCNWRPSNLYTTVEVCESDGKTQIGKPVFSDIAEDRKISDYRCGKIFVYEKPAP